MAISVKAAYGFVAVEKEVEQVALPELTRSELRAIVRLEGGIDAMLIEWFHQRGGTPCHYHVKDGVPQKLADEIVRRFTEQGWRVHVIADLAQTPYKDLTSGTLFEFAPKRLSGTATTSDTALPRLSTVVDGASQSAIVRGDTNWVCGIRRLLVRMPTRSRPKQALDVLTKYRSMAGAPIQIEVVVDEDDETMQAIEVVRRLVALGCTITVGQHKNKVEACNGGRVQDWDVLLLASDDMVPIVNGYAVKVLEAMERYWPYLDGALYFDDGYQGKDLCTLPIMGRRWYDRWGYVYHPSYRSLHCDAEQTELWTVMGRLTYIDEKIIEHRHPAWGHGLKDALYEKNDAFDGPDKKNYEQRKLVVRPGAQFAFDTPPLQLSICVCTLPARRAQLDRLLEHLFVQRSSHVEICVDDREGITIGEKRQALLERAKGHFVCFVDDDDWVSHDYVFRILNAFDAIPDADCAALVGMMTTNGECPERFEHSIVHTEWGEKDGVLIRPPNHLNAVRRELALKVGFVAKSHGEDHDFSTRLRPLLKKEARTDDRPLYYYFVDTTQKKAIVVTDGVPNTTKSSGAQAYNVSITDLDTKPQNMCFYEVAQAFGDALRTLGHDVNSPESMATGRCILFGANDVDAKRIIPLDAVIFNAEQLPGKPNPRQLIGGIPAEQIVWDYSESNVARLQELGQRAVYCPIGYVPSMTTIEPVDEDIDVLFYGWVNERREWILSALDDAGLKVVRLFGPFGRERDAYIARSKVVLNLHFYDESVFEIFRCSHLFANRKCVVTEDGGKDPTLEDLAKRACAYTPRGHIVEACRHLVDSAQARQAVAERGFEEFKKIDLVENVRRALEQS